MRYRGRCPHCGRDTFFQQIEAISLPDLSMEKLLTDRIEALEWLVEAQDLRVHRVIHAGEWAQKNAGPSVREAWKRRENSNYELRDTLKSARDCAGL